MSRKISTGAVSALVIAGLVLAAFGGLAEAKDKPGKGKGRAKIVLCHKGKVTLRVGAPALRAHLKHGDQPGACSTQQAVRPGPSQSLLVVFKYVVNDNHGTKTPSDFTLTINGVTAAGGNSLPGSAAGVAKIILTSGVYSVTESAVPGYLLTSASAGCSGTIAAGQEKTCLLVNDDAQS